MMPVAALAACGIILGITSALLKTQVQDAVPFLTASVPLFIITTLNKVSGIVFTLLPVLFAISIAFGLAKEDKGVAAFAGFIGYYISGCQQLYDINRNNGFQCHENIKYSWRGYR